MTKHSDKDPIQGFLSDLHRRGRAPNTLRTRYSVLTHAQRRLGKSLIDTTAEELGDYIHNPEVAWSSWHRRTVQLSLTLFMRWAYSEGLTARDESMKIESLPAPHEPPKSPVPLEVLVSALERADLYQRAMLSLGCPSGLRRFEIATAHPANREDRFLRVPGKGGRVRRVPLDEIGYRALREIERQQGTDDYYFRGRWAGHMHKDTVAQQIKQCLGGEWACHSLRRRAAREWLATTGNIRVVQELLGHSSLNEVARYVAVSDEELSAAVNGASVAAMRNTQRIAGGPSSMEANHVEFLDLLAQVRNRARDYGMEVLIR